MLPLANFISAPLRLPVDRVMLLVPALKTKFVRPERSRIVPLSALEDPLLPMVNPPLSNNVPLPFIAAEVTKLFTATLKPTVVGPLTVSVTPAGICVTCHAPEVVLVKFKFAIVVFAGTTLLIVEALADVPVAPNVAVSVVEPPKPGKLATSQFPFTFQLFAAGLATFQV